MHIFKVEELTEFDADIILDYVDFVFRHSKRGVIKDFLKGGLMAMLSRDEILTATDDNGTVYNIYEDTYIWSTAGPHHKSKYRLRFEDCRYGCAILLRIDGDVKRYDLPVFIKLAMDVDVRANHCRALSHWFTPQELVSNDYRIRREIYDLFRVPYPAT